MLLGAGDAVQVDLKVISTILSALKGTNKPFIGSSGAAVYGDLADPVDESTPVSASWGKGTRAEAEQLLLEVTASLHNMQSKALPA